VTDVWSGFVTLTADECRRLLRANQIGRVAVTSGALPCVLPVQYALESERLLLRTPGHHEVGHGIDGQVVGFETDDLDLEHGVGWCVSVTGTAQVVHDAGDLDEIHPWFSDGVVLALTTDVLVGHRVAV
jgi:nitroimidazol reductase NimA-like FMN-containing flavoprotein (pyridoxamine 5'-phosphate oxidase superfamily)